MLWNRCKNVTTWLAVVAGILGTGAWAQAQSGEAPHRRVVKLLRLPFNAGVLKVVLAADPEDAPLIDDGDERPRRVIVQDVLIDDTDKPANDRRWIGLSCYPADDTLRNQLKLAENEGLVVEAVVPEGPAAKAGIEAGDVLLKAGDKPLADVPDLVKAIADAGDKPLSLAVLRSGESKAIEVTPAVRDDEAGFPFPLEPGEVRHWLERAGAAVPHLAQRLGRDVLFLRAGSPLAVEFPADLSVTINKSGNEPGKVVVKKGDQTWEVAENELNKLPDEVRGYIEMYLGKAPTPPLPKELEEKLGAIKPFTLPLPPPGAPGAPAPPDLDSLRRRAEDEARRVERRLYREVAPHAQELQDRLEKLEKRLQERLEQIDKLLEGLKEKGEAVDQAEKTEGV
ncbi:MAG: PDZ domain-containing protein [Pirellulales bacterium]|nr:PDZ domain-containing protein [Pirellulales bacterium]